MISLLVTADKALLCRWHGRYTLLYKQAV